MLFFAVYFFLCVRFYLFSLFFFFPFLCARHRFRSLYLVPEINFPFVRTDCNEKESIFLPAEDTKLVLQITYLQ